jgi:hypothetical protein
MVTNVLTWIWAMKSYVHDWPTDYIGVNNYSINSGHTLLTLHLWGWRKYE